MTSLTTTDAKAKFLSLIRKAHEFGQHYVITHRGEDFAILLGSEDYQGLLETLDILQNNKEVKNIQESLKDLQKGETYSFEQVVGRKQKK